MTDLIEPAANTEVVRYTAWDPETGQVKAASMSPRAMLNLAHPGLRKLVGEWLDHTTQYVDPVTGEPSERPTWEPILDRSEVRAGGDEVATITGVPVGAFLTGFGVEGPVTVDDGVVEFSAALPGVYTLAFDAFPHQHVEVVIYAREG